MFVRQEILPEENLPSAQEVCELGQSLARDWSIGNCEFFRAHACSSEAQYKLRCMEQGRIMQHAHMGFRNADKSFNAYSEIYERCLSHGVEIDRYGICLDWSMGYPAAQRESQLKGTGLILRDAEAFVELTSRAPVASHFGDFMLGFPGALENTCHALAAGVTSIGNLGQYFTFQLPGWRDDVETTRSTLGAIALMAAQPETVLIHSNLDDGFAAVFEDLSSAVGAAMLERYLVEDLMGGHIAHCYGHHYSTPELRFAFHHALADVSSTPGSMVYGNTTSYRGTAAENFASMVERVHEELEIYPLLAYPCKVIDHGGIVRLPGNHGKPYSGTPEVGAFLDIGIYGIPQRIQDGDEQFDTVTRVRRIEDHVRKMGGFLHTYCDVFSTEEEFMEMFDHTLWQEMRDKYEANGAFPTIYEKVKPEMDPLSFLEEERTWREGSDDSTEVHRSAVPFRQEASRRQP